MTVSNMVTTLRKCKGSEGNTFNHFLPSVDKDFSELCAGCQGTNFAPIGLLKSGTVFRLVDKFAEQYWRKEEMNA